MPIFVFFIIWYALYGKNNPKIFRTLEDKIPKIIGILILISVFSSMIPHVLSASIALIFSLAPLIFIGWLIYRLSGRGKKKDQRSDYTYYQNNYQAEEKKRGMGTSVTGLTRSVPKRRKIVEKFNKKYKLSLTEKEIERIVDASYVSNCWEREIYDMDREYDTLYQWYNGASGWLRAYLHAFPVQSVSSDFEMQRNICMDSFDQIFRDIQPGKFATIDDCVDAINNRYMTVFDETTFMIAYRFLESNGRKYELPHLGVMRNESEMDRLKRKYDEAAENMAGQTRTRTMM
ncbi:MAG: hypothetical protein ACI39Q_06390 [Wujia sp.]